jgi:hypothetical protein
VGALTGTGGRRAAGGPGAGVPPRRLSSGGLQAHGTARGNEVVLFLPERRALVAGDVLLGDGDGELRLCPESWLPTGVGQRELRTSLLPLLELPIDRVLVSHGRSVLREGSSALRRVLHT